MLTCSNCGRENPDGAKFCMECATPLDTAPVRHAAEERKVVTALFCDLVGFTATSESADPEDVGTMLAAYFAMARAQIEAHGGTVEKFIGDAVVGVFGVPAAHEDDPERAVRAGLRICEDAEDLTSIGGAPLKLRVGINTGEALVRLGVSAASGEGFLTGDSINTASRIQSVAPEMGVAVGLATYQATAQVFDYAELDPATLKGKIEPVRIFHAKAPRARLGTDLTRTHDSPYIGREIDLALLKGVFDKIVAAAAPQLVTVIGEPGLGKSRIVAELGAYVGTKPDLITWRQGRCLPYGEGITFWALGEILKAHAGILESDTMAVAESKLDVVLPEGEERPWFRQRLLPLLGIEATSSAEREELFTAWRGFLEHIAEQHPTVLVFEDLHWADEAMLSFLEHLADRAECVPLLVVGTARPELFERHPDFAAGLRNTNSINLAPLTEEETARLVSALLRTTVIPAELQQPILERAGGNPLYAEEFVRLLGDKDLLVEKGGSWELREGAEVPFPDSIQALIAARLDTLTPDTKSLLADASVIGKVFWAGAIAEMGERDPNEVAESLRELSRKELVRPARRSSIEGEAEYAFWHVLARDVAYGQLTRASRASRHVAAARWIESKVQERVEDLADVLAYHYTTALELARAAGRTGEAVELEAPALRFLTLAGERAADLDVEAALTLFERAVTLTPSGHPQRARTMLLFGTTLVEAGQRDRGRAAIGEAIALAREQDDPLLLASALCENAWGWSTDPVAEALSVLEPLPAGPEQISALETMAMLFGRSGRPAEMLMWAERAQALAAEAGLPARRAGWWAAIAKCQLGRAEGIEEMRAVFRAEIDAGSGGAVWAAVWLGSELVDHEGPFAAEEVYREGAKIAEARGLVWAANANQVNVAWVGLFAGRFEEAISAFSRLREGSSLSATDDREIGWEVTRARIWRGEEDLGDVAAQVRTIDQFLATLDEASRDTDSRVHALSTRALFNARLGDTDSMRTSMEQLLSTPRAGHSQFYAFDLPAMVRSAVAGGDLTIARRLVAASEMPVPFALHARVTASAALDEADGRLEEAVVGYTDAARRWQAFGVLPEQGLALLGQGRCLLGLSRAREASAVLHEARDVFAHCGMRPALEETDDLIQRASALSS